jgi:hypothetical protein
MVSEDAEPGVHCLAAQQDVDVTHGPGAESVRIEPGNGAAFEDDRLDSCVV